MARIYSCGFELNSVSAGVEFGGVQGTVAIDSTVKHSGSYSLHSLETGVNSAEQQIFGTDDIGPFWTRIYLYVHAAPTARHGIIYFGNASGQQSCAIALETDRTLKLFTTATQIGSASSVLSLDTWYWVELYAEISGGAMNVTARLNGTSFASGSSSTAPDPRYFSFCRVGFQGGSAGNTGDIYFDDWAINDNNGVNQLSWPGDGSVILLSPNAAGDNADWSRGGTDSGANWSQVDERPPNDATDYVGSNTLNQKDDHNLSLLAD